MGRRNYIKLGELIKFQLKLSNTFVRKLKSITGNENSILYIERAQAAVGVFAHKLFLHRGIE